VQQLAVPTEGEPRAEVKGVLHLGFCPEDDLDIAEAVSPSFPRATAVPELPSSPSSE
jgi:hypothetical protein